MSLPFCQGSGDPCLIGDPVDTSKGAAVDQTLDFRLTGPLELWWMRHYNSSQSHCRFALGWGHTHDFDRRLRFDADGLRYVAPLGRVIGFPPLLQDNDECARDGYLLRRTSLLCYEVYRHGEPAMEFEFRDLREPARPKCLFKGRNKIIFEYDQRARWERIVDSAGRRIKVIEEADGRIISLALEATQGNPETPLLSYTYDERGNLISTLDSSGHGFVCAYDNQNRMIRRTGRKGFSFYFTFDSKGRCTKSTGDGRMHEVSLDYDPSGRITKVTRGDGGIWTYVFNETGGLAKIIDPLGGVQEFVRDKTGRITSEMDTNGNSTRMVYDAAGAPISKITPLGHSVSLPEDPNAPDPTWHRVAANPTEYEYGRLLNLDEITLPQMSELGVLAVPYAARPLVVTRELDNPSSSVERSFHPKPLGPIWWPRPKQGRVFDHLGKLIRQVDDWGKSRQWSYDASGNVIRYMDFDGRIWSYDRGSWHLLLAETNPLNATVKFSYNTSGEISTFTDAGGTHSEYVYDLKDQLMEVKRHGLVRDRYTRDAAGNLIAKYACDGRLLLQLEIGTGNLPVKRILASGDEHTFEYDKQGRHLLAATKKDRSEFEYDAFGNRSLEKRNGQGVEHRFRGWNMPAESVFFGHFSVQYDRGADSTIVMTDPGGKKHQIRFLPHSVVERRFSNGSVEVAQYDNQGRCLFKQAQCVNSLWSRRFQWSGEGELLQVEDNRYGTIRHQYDAAHRLRRRLLPNGGVEEFEHDRANNLLRQPGLDSVVVYEGNRLKTANGESIIYNDRNHIALRQTQRGSIQYTYDSRDQLIRVATPQSSWLAEYDALNRRTRKTWQRQSTEYYWNSDQLIAEVGEDGSVRLYLYADPLALTPLIFLEYDSVEASPESCRRFYIFSDQIGTPCLVEDESRFEVWRADIQPFGAIKISTEAKIAFNLRFPGHYADPELGLSYNRFRYYDPSLGRYIQSDPWGIAGGYNVYAYRSNPLLDVDVRGLGEKDNPDCPHPKDDEESSKIGRPPGEHPPPDSKTVQATGEPSAATTWRQSEVPYRNPPEMHVVKPGQPLDVNALDTKRTYLWVVDPHGNVIIAPEGQPDFGRTVKHGDLTPGPEGAYRGPARAGGELNYNQDNENWVMDNNSSYTFAREDGRTGTGDNLNASHDLLTQSGTDTSNIDTKNSHGIQDNPW